MVSEGTPLGFGGRPSQTPIAGGAPAPLDATVLGGDGIGRLARYWYDLAAAEGGVPRRAAFDPTRLIALLPQIIVLEHLGDHDFRYRLLGTEVERFAKRSYTGQRTSEIPGHGPGNRIHALYVAALTADRPVGMTLPYAGKSAACTSVRQVAAPLRAEPWQVVSLIEFELRAELSEQQVTAARRALF